MVRHKPFTRTEMKILVYNKMKTRGMSYENACKELQQEIDKIIDNDVKFEEQQKKEDRKKDVKKKFDEEFEKLKNGKKR